MGNKAIIPSAESIRISLFERLENSSFIFVSIKTNFKVLGILVSIFEEAMPLILKVFLLACICFRRNLFSSRMLLLEELIRVHRK